MDCESGGTMEVAALGRPFGLGMLYDCRKDSLITGITLWDRDDLKNHIGERPQSYNDFEIVASESIEDKTSALNVDASLKASFLGGLVDVSGSAKYLNDSKSSRNQARVTLNYKATTKILELSMNHLGKGKVKHLYVFDKGLATHVVTAILYGAQAFFVFDREVSENENHQDIQGNLKVMIKKVPCLSIDGEGSLKMEDNDRAKVDKFSCRFFGDFCLQKTPTTFQDAVEVYQSLPTLLGANGEKAVPMKVWLLPLTSLHSTAAKLVRQISIRLVQEAQTVLEDFSELDMRCNDALMTTTAQQFPQIGKKIKGFKEMCSEFKLEFQRTLAKKLPSIRGGGEEEAELADILKKRHSSPFNSKNLNEWMDCKEREIYTLMSFTNMMKNTKIIPSQTDLFKESLSAEHAVCFVFTSLGSDEPYLSALSNYLEGTTKPGELQDPRTHDVQKEQWYLSNETANEMREKAKLFSDFAEANMENKNTKFLTVGLTNETHKGSSIYLYKDGFSVSENFEPPSKPETVTAGDINHNSMNLKVSPPRFGAENITSYSVEFCVSGEQEWQQKAALKAGEVTVSNLRPNTEYMFRCRAVTSAGVGPANVVSDSIKTLPCSPPGEPHVEAHSCVISDSQKPPVLEAIITSGVPCPTTNDGLPVHFKFNHSAQTVLEDFSEMDMRCNDALRTTTAQQFPQIGKKIKDFKEMCSEFKLEFQRTLAKKLPSIRGGGEEEAELAAILKKRHSSPFNSESLNEWMDCKEREIYTLMSFTDMMKDIKIIPSQTGLDEELFNAGHAVCFVFTSLGSDEPYLSALSDYLEGTTKPGELQDPRTHDVQKEQWYLSKDTANEMREKAKLFSDFAEANMENKNAKFLTVGLTNETQKGSSIYLYEEGFSVSENFEPPSKPETVTAGDINHNSVNLKVSPPRFGAENITSYSVEFCVSGEQEWQQKAALKAGEVTVSDLRPNTEYMFRCRAVTSAGVGPANVVSDSIKTLPCSPPGEPHVEAHSCEISVSWKKPAELGQDVQIVRYILEFAQTDNKVKLEALQWKQMMTTTEEEIISGLQSETRYAVRVRCDCGVDGQSKASITVNVSTTFKRLAEIIRCASERMNSDSPSIYKLKLEEQHVNIRGCRKFNFGKESMRKNRTIMFLGATGSGKSTLINGMINYILGVQWKDSYRFKLVHEDQSRSQSHSQTSEVTVYKINHQEGFKINHSLTIIDTPGFGDTRGIDRDKLITEQIRNLFSDQRGVTEIDAVCVVAQSALPRLTPTQKYVFDSVLSIFGKDVAENIRILVTFADGQKPPVLKAIIASGVPCPTTDDGLPVHFRFNNFAMFANNKSSVTDNTGDDEDDGRGFDQMFWNMGTQSMMEFFAALNVIETKSLTLTKEVLRERQQLEVSVESLQKQVKLGLAKMEEINETTKQLKDHEAEISRNKDFVIETTVMKPFYQDISGSGTYITNCQQCHVTCHYPCGIPNDADKIRCSAMTDGKCTQCPKKCNWNVHFNQKYRWEYKQVTEKTTKEQLKEKYLKASKEKMTVQGVIDGMKAVYDRVQTDVKKLTDTSAKCLNRLKEIALKPNPLSTPDYIDMLIEGEKSEAKPGWKQRVESLMAMKQKAELMVKVEKGEKFL